MNPLLEQLHDIEGIDSISVWPLAIGWWIIIFISLAILVFLGIYAIKWIAFKRSWKHDTLQKLALLESNFSDENAKDTVIALSEYLRRIAIRRFSRQECAGLTGEAWLKWLTLHDPEGYDWQNKAILLINMPYAPLNAGISASSLKELIQAIRNWVL
jgi:uncharacterized protein DUF4381